MENGCGGRSLSLSFRMESTTGGARIPRLAEFARIKTNSSGLSRVLCFRHELGLKGMGRYVPPPGGLSKKLHAKGAAEKQQSITLVNQSFDERRVWLCAQTPRTNPRSKTSPTITSR